MLKILVTVGALQVIAIVVGMLRAKVLALLLGPAGIGVISVIDQTVQLVAYVSAFSLPYTSVKFLSRAHSRAATDFQDTFSGLAQLLGLLSIVGAGLAVVVVLFAPGALPSGARPYRFIVIPALAAVPAASLNSFFANTLAAAQRSRTSALWSFVGAIALAAAAVIGVSLAGVRGLYWGNFVAVILVAVVFSVYLHRILHVSALRKRIDIRSTLRKNPDVMPFAFVLYLTTFTTTAAYLVARVAILGAAGEVEAGLLQAAIALSGALGLALSPVNGLYLTPILNREIPRSAKLTAAAEFQTKLTLLIGALAAPIVLFPQVLLVVLYSGAFVRVSSLVFLFVIGQGMLQLAGVYQAVLIGFDDLKAYGTITAAGYVLLGGSAFVLAPQLGILGVAIGFLAASALVFVLSLFRLTRRHHLVTSVDLIRTMAFGVGALTLLGYVGSRLNAFTPQNILLKLAFGGLYLALLLWITSRQEIRRVVGRGWGVRVTQA